MKSKLILCLALVLSGGLFGCTSVKPSVRLQSCQPPKLLTPEDRFIRLYEDSSIHFFENSSYQFGYMSSTRSAVLVFSQARQQWKRITQVSLTNAKLGHSPFSVPGYWNFSKSYHGKEYAPLPLRTGKNGLSGYAILPDKIEYDDSRAVYLMWFTTEQGAGPKDDTVPTRLEIKKIDLDKAFKTQETTNSPPTPGSY